jgi:hypothetical protein
MIARGWITRDDNQLTALGAPIARSAAVMQLPARDRIRTLDQLSAAESEAVLAEMERLLTVHRKAALDAAEASSK